MKERQRDKKAGTRYVKAVEAAEAAAETMRQRVLTGSDATSATRTEAAVEAEAEAAAEVVRKRNYLNWSSGTVYGTEIGVHDITQAGGTVSTESAHDDNAIHTCMGSHRTPAAPADVSLTTLNNISPI